MIASERFAEEITLKRMTGRALTYKIEKNPADSCYELSKDNMCGGCFEENTKITRLSKDTSTFIEPWSRWSAARKDELGSISKDDLSAKKVSIKDIERNDLVLSSTLSSLLSEKYHETCWAEVGDVYNSTLGAWSYEGFTEVSYAAFTTKGKILTTPKHSFYGHTDSRNIRWIKSEKNRF